MSGLLVNAVHLENTYGNHDKFYRILTVDGTHLITAYGPRGRTPGTTNLTWHPNADHELDNTAGRKRISGYDLIASLRYTSDLPDDTATSDPAALIRELDQQWAAQTAPQVRALTASAAADPDTGPLHLAVLPTFLPRRGPVGGHRDSRPWGHLLAEQLHHIRPVPNSRDTAAVVTAPVAAWVARTYPGAQVVDLPTTSDPAALLGSIVDLTAVRGLGHLTDIVRIAAAVLA